MSSVEKVIIVNGTTSDCDVAEERAMVKAVPLATVQRWHFR